MFKKMRERAIIKKIQKIKKRDGNHWLSYLSLNTIQSKAAAQLINDKISLEFYKKVFHGGDMYNHWSDVNADFISNYFIKNA